MSNNDKEFMFVPFGIFGSLAVGIGLFMAGAVTGTFLLSIVGVIVIVGGMMITIACTVAKAIKKNGGLTAYQTEEKPTHDNSDEADDDDYPPDDELIESVTARGPHKDVEELLKREDALLDLLYKYDMDELKSEYYDESELLWNNYRGSAWDENLDKIDALIDEYYKLFNAEKAEKSKIADEEDQKNADFEEISKQPSIEATPEREVSARENNSEKIEENSKDVNIKISEQDDIESNAEEEKIEKNTRIEEDQKNEQDDNKSNVVESKTKSAAVGYRPMKKK